MNEEMAKYDQWQRALCARLNENDKFENIIYFISLNDEGIVNGIIADNLLTGKTLAIYDSSYSAYYWSIANPTFSEERALQKAEINCIKYVKDWIEYNS